MKITVAMRVIGGFLTITVLLLAVGISALLNLNDISNNSSDVNDKALPTLNSSNQLQISFLTMSKLTLQAYYEQENEAELTRLRSRFNDYKNEFEQSLSSLNGIVGDQKQFLVNVTELESIYGRYIVNVNTLFDARQATLDAASQLSDIKDSLEETADDTSTLLLDFSDSDEVQSNDRLSEAAEVGSEIETALMSLVSVSNEYAKTRNLTRAETIGNEVKLVLTRVRENFQTMQSQVGDDPTGMVSEISDMLVELESLVSSADGLLQTQVLRLNKQLEAQNSLMSSETNIENALSELRGLLNIAGEQAKKASVAVNKSVSSGTTWTTIIMVVAVVAAIAIAYLVVRAIITPLGKVNDILNVVAQGDLTRKLDDSSQDEFGELASNCNNLIDSLKTLIAGISSRAAQLAAAAEETSAVTSQTTSSIQEQKSQVAQVATATTEMNSTSELVTRNAEDTLHQIKQADAEAERVKSISSENRGTIISLAREVESAAEVINKLHQDSASIGGILDVIRGVADQTNLLALNAAIEAARAGEQGRGFAVVADEVRTLASRTQESTQEIQSMIEMLQVGAEKAVAVMTQGKAQADECVTQTESATTALDSITDAVHHAYDVSAQIEQSAQEQHRVSQEISERLESIVTIAEETASGAEQTSDSSHEVAKLAEELQASIQQFRV